MSEEEKTFKVDLEQLDNFTFKVNFGLQGVDDLLMDEPEPLGKSMGPNASRVLAAAMGNCLSSSLLFCLQRARAPVKGMKTKVQGKMSRNEKGRWRIVEVSVELTPNVDKEYVSQMDRCLKLFEDFCIVSKSVEQGIPLKVKVNWD